MIKARDIMTTDVITVHESMSVRDLARLLAEKKISGAPVVNDHGALVGVVTESDLIDQVKRVHIPTVMALFDAFLFLENPDRLEQDLKKMAASTAGEICSKNPVTVGPDTPLDELATRMSEDGIHTLPVMDEGRITGIIGKTDIIRSMARQQ